MLMKSDMTDVRVTLLFDKRYNLNHENNQTKSKCLTQQRYYPG